MLARDGQQLGPRARRHPGAEVHVRVVGALARDPVRVAEAVLLRPGRRAHGRDDVVPVLLAAADHRDVAVAAGEDLVRVRPAGLRRLAAGARPALAVGEVHARVDAGEGGDQLGDRDVDALALPAAQRGEDARERGRRCVGAALVVGEVEGERERGAVGLTDHPAGRAQRRRRQRAAGHVAVGAHVAERRDGHRHELGMPADDRVEVEPERPAPRDRLVADERRRACEQGLEPVAVRRRVEVEHDAALVVVERVEEPALLGVGLIREWPVTARGVTGGRLHLDDVGAEVGEQPGRVRRGDVLAPLDDAEAGQGSGGSIQNDRSMLRRRRARRQRR